MAASSQRLKSEVMNFSSNRNSMKESCLSVHLEAREKSHSLTNNDTNYSRDFFSEKDENMRNDDNGDLVKFLIDEERDEDDS
jgi:hypothetical protein